MIALEILKHMLKLSDEKLVHQLQTNIEVQYFCGIQNMYDETNMEPSSLSHFRTRLTKHTEVMKEIQNIHLQETVRKLPKKVRLQYDQDSTVINENIKYPHDIDLLHDIVQ
jgi:glycogen synthase